MKFSMAMMDTGYFLTFVAGTQVIVGFLLLTGIIALGSPTRVGSNHFEYSCVPSFLNAGF